MNKVTIKPKTIYEITDIEGNQKWEVEGIKGLENHLSDCLSSFSDMLYSECCSSNSIEFKMNIKQFLLDKKDHYQMIANFIDEIETVKIDSKCDFD